MVSSPLSPARTTRLRLRLSPPESFLVECIRHRDHLDKKRLCDLYEWLGDNVTYDICSKNKILSLAADSLSCAGVELSDRWLHHLHSTHSLISDYLLELDESATLLRAHGIPLVALKNSGIARCLYTYPASSPMGDIDVLVDKKYFRLAHKLLLSRGYTLRFRSPLEKDNIDSAEKGGGAEYSVRLRSGQHLWFELQWRPVAGRWIRPDQEPDASELIARSLPIDGSDARILSPEDNLLQVCLHTAKHSYVRAPGFRLHTDVDRIVRSCDINWTLFVDMTNRLTVRTPVFFSLAFAADLLSSPIPNEVFTALSPPRWKVILLSRWLQHVGLFYPDDPKWHNLSYIFFVSLLYDSIGDLCRSLAPPLTYSDNASKQSLFLYPFHLFSRLIDLSFNRTLVRKKR